MDRLDKTDRAIIACLQYDGRMPFTTIAKRLGISQATVRNRVARMRDDGTLQVVGVVDPHLLGLRSTAIVGIVVEPARLDSVARSLAAFEEVSYLVMNAGTVDKILIAIERGLPFIYSNYGMAGASTPITPAGSLALLNAELLAGLTLSQLVCEGTPVILGSLPASFDMRGTGSFYSTTGYLLNLACAERPISRAISFPI